MQFDDAQKLRKENLAKKCGHPEIEKEYYLGAHTGDYICTSCGETFYSTSAWEAQRDSTLDEKDKTGH